MCTLALLLSSTLSLATESLRDPTRPLGFVSKKSKTESLILHSVLMSKQRKVALINGQQLTENDVIAGSGGVVLEHIMPHSVQVSLAGKRWQVYLQNNRGLKKTPVNR